MADWSFVLTDRTYKPVGEILNAQERKVANPLSKLDTASLKVRLDHPLADALLSCKGYLKAYRNGALRFMGPMVSAEESVDAQSATIAVNAVGTGWYFTKRLVGKSATGTIFSTLTDRAEIVRLLLAAINTENDTGVATTAAVSAASAVTYIAGPYRPLLDVLNELASAYDGFDWRVLPVETYANGAVTGTSMGTFTAAPVIGIDSTASAVFEYGTGRSNVESYKRTLSREGQANQVYHVANGGGVAGAYPVVSAIDATSVSDWRLLEDLAQADLLDPTMRAQLVSEHVRVRKQPRQVIEFVPSSQLSGLGDHRVPNPGTDFDVGDVVTGRARYGTSTRFDGAFRVYGLSFDIDDLGNEKTTVTTVEEAS